MVILSKNWQPEVNLFCIYLNMGNLSTGHKSYVLLRIQALLASMLLECPQITEMNTLCPISLDILCVSLAEIRDIFAVSICFLLPNYQA